MSQLEIPIGFVGLGRMGMPIARRLASVPGYALITCDTSAGRDVGGATATSPAELAARAEVIFTCLPNEAAVREVYLGAAGLYASEGAVKATCDLSTISPELAIEIAEAAAARGICHVEAPMIGGVPESTDGTLYLVLAAANTQSVDDLPAPLPHLLAQVSRKTILAGPPGTASQMKIVQNGLGVVQLVGIAEALATCRHIGLDPDVFAEFVIEAKGMAGRLLFAEVAHKMLHAPAVSTASIGVPAKDVQLFADLSAVLGDGLVSEAAAKLLARAAIQLGDVDYTQMIRLFDAPVRD